MEEKRSQTRFFLMPEYFAKTTASRQFSMLRTYLAAPARKNFRPFFISYNARDYVTPSTDVHGKIRTKPNTIPTTATRLPDGSLFIKRLPLSTPEEMLKAPLLNPNPKPKKTGATPETIAEIRRLRAEDPDKWTCKMLAEKFDVTPLYVGLVAPLKKVNKEKQEKLDEEMKKMVENMGWRKRLVRDERKRRRDLWFK